MIYVDRNTAMARLTVQPTSGENVHRSEQLHVINKYLIINLNGISHHTGQCRTLEIKT
ncbi:hypothetical protein X777_00781 [Ooceraea biroi]|uniref:Uncharacterized protein n=1 Tax=Ooceraea biroi TaxID=2015173 RepID=A0A026WPU7_OOCBI|nr:hypothetical protein X777_00781 [Ooceraea biroi]